AASPHTGITVSPGATGAFPVSPSRSPRCHLKHCPLRCHPVSPVSRSVFGPRSHHRSWLLRFGSHLRWVRMLVTRCCSFGPKRLKGVLISPCCWVLVVVKPSTLTAMSCSVVRFSFARYFLISGSHASTSKRVSCSGAIVCSSNSRLGHQGTPPR